MAVFKDGERVDKVSDRHYEILASHGNYDAIPQNKMQKAMSDAAATKAQQQAKLSNFLVASLVDHLTNNLNLLHLLGATAVLGIDLMVVGNVWRVLDSLEAMSPCLIRMGTGISLS